MQQIKTTSISMQSEAQIVQCRPLIDQNISFRRKDKLSNMFVAVAHVKTAGLLDADDLQIWNFARRDNSVTLTQDADFNAINELKGWPPKIIWLRCGNRTTTELTDIMRKSLTASGLFADDAESGLLEIYK